MLKYPRLLRLFFCLAFFQILAPSVIAIADAWRMDGREAFAHVESSTDSNCIVVHHEDCALCGYVGGCGALPAVRELVESRRADDPPRVDRYQRLHSVVAASSRSRAPPVG